MQLILDLCRASLCGATGSQMKMRPRQLHRLCITTLVQPKSPHSESAATFEYGVIQAACLRTAAVGLADVNVSLHSPEQQAQEPAFNQGTGCMCHSQRRAAKLFADACIDHQMLVMNTGSISS